MVGCLACAFRCAQRASGRHPEDVLRAVLVSVLGVGAARLLRHELRVLFLEGVGDVFEEDQAEDDVLVFGRVHAAPQRIGHLPELGFVTDSGAVAARLSIVGGRRSSLWPLRHSHSLAFFTRSSMAITTMTERLRLATALGSRARSIRRPQSYLASFAVRTFIRFPVAPDQL